MKQLWFLLWIVSVLFLSGFGLATGLGLTVHETGRTIFLTSYFLSLAVPSGISLKAIIDGGRRP